MAASSEGQLASIQVAEESFLMPVAVDKVVGVRQMHNIWNRYLLIESSTEFQIYDLAQISESE